MYAGFIIAYLNQQCKVFSIRGWIFATVTFHRGSRQVYLWYSEKWMHMDYPDSEWKICTFWCSSWHPIPAVRQTCKFSKYQPGGKKFLRLASGADSICSGSRLLLCHIFYSGIQFIPSYWRIHSFFRWISSIKNKIRIATNAKSL